MVTHSLGRVGLRSVSRKTFVEELSFWFLCVFEMMGQLIGQSRGDWIRFILH